MAQNHYNVLHTGVQPRNTHEYYLPHPKDEYGFEAKRRIKSSSSAEMESPAMFERERRLWQRAINQSNWAELGSGMQAVFLGPKRKSCGTGVFIPRAQGIDLQSNDKPAFSPVLLPCRVIQALNLNVHELGQHIKGQSEQDKNIEVEIKNEEKLEKQKEDDISFSPEIFLPKEWTY